jgi:PKD domain/Bacterial Ig domain
LVAVVAAGVLTTPAPASATTFTVDHSFSSGCDGAHNCGSIQSAVDAAGRGDSIDVRAGSYEENVTVPAAKDGLTIAGSGRPTITGAVKVSSGGVTLAALLLQRTGGADAPVLELAGDAAPPATLSSSVVLQQSSSSDTPAVLVDGSGGATIIDSSALSSTGPALRIIRGDSNRLIRSTLTAIAPGSNGVEIRSASDDPSSKSLDVDSAIVSGGASAAGLKLASDPGIPFSSAGPIALDAVHLTTAGAANGIVLDAQANGSSLGSGAAGQIRADVRSSIVHGANQTNRFSGDLAHMPSSATLNLSDTDTSTRDDQLFANPGARDFHLRAGAPVIDTVAGPAGGESDRDVDGDPRVMTGNGFANRNLADKGADEFSNRPPTARLSSPATTARERVGVPFDASGSTDPDAGGGGVVAYAYSYGDGSTEAGGSPHALHAYSVKGIYNATVSVLDAQGGLSSPSAPVTIAVTDGTAPVAAILAPKNGALFKPGRAIAIAGQAADESGLRSVEVSVRYAGVKKTAHTRKRRRRASRAAARKRTCSYVTPAAKLAKGSCTSPTYYPAMLTDRRWTFRLKRRNRLPRGKYEIRVRATDIAGNASDAPSAAAGTLVTFRIA